MIIDKNEKFIRINEVIQKTSLPRATIFAKIKEGKFPAPIPLSSRTRAWSIIEVTEWMEAKKKERDQLSRS